MNRSQEFAQVVAAEGYFFPSSEASNSASAFRDLLVGGGVDRLERLGDLLAVGVGHEPHRGPDQVDDAGLDHRVRPGRLDRLWQALEAVAADDQHVPHAPVGQVRADVGPKRRALGVLDPDPQHVLDPLEVHADGDIGGTVDDLAVLPDLDPDRVEVDHRIELLQRPRLPSQHLLADRVGDIADRLV